MSWPKRGRRTWVAAERTSFALALGLLGLWIWSAFVAADSIVVLTAGQQFALVAFDGWLQVSHRVRWIEHPVWDADGPDNWGEFGGRGEPTETDETDDLDRWPVVVRHHGCRTEDFGELGRSASAGHHLLWWRSELIDDGQELTAADSALDLAASGRAAAGDGPPDVDAVVHPTVYVSRLRRATVPIWELVALAAVLPAGRGVVATGRWWRRRRPPPGHCSRCAYDLRASPGRCSECGTAVPPE